MTDSSHSSPVRSTPPGVSVVVPHYGDPTPTCALLSALRTQFYDGPVQVIVADDCSPEPFPATDLATVVRRDRNGGFGSAVNTGASQAAHPRLLILNSDLDVGADFLAELVRAAEPWMPAVIGPRLVGHDGSSGWSGRHFPTASQQFVEWLTPLARWRHLPRLHEAVGHDTRCVDGATAAVDWLVGAALYLPTDAFHAVGGFDEGFFMNSEEIDLQRRLRDAGLPSVFLGSVSVRHEGGGSSGDAARRRRWLVSSRLRYARKWGGLGRLRLGLTLATGLNLVVNAGRRGAGRPVHPLRVAAGEWDLIWRTTEDRP